MIVDDISKWVFGGSAMSWWDVARRGAMFWGPVVSLPGLGGPTGLLATLLGVVLLSGVALSSLAVFLLAAVALHLILTEILGVSLEITLA